MAEHAARKHERFDAVVEVTVHSGHNFWTGVTQNISQGGLFLVTDHPQPVGSKIRFHLQLPPDPSFHEVEGEVRWIRSHETASEHLPAGMGVRFAALSDELAASIATFIAKQRDSLLWDDEDE